MLLLVENFWKRTITWKCLNSKFVSWKQTYQLNAYRVIQFTYIERLDPLKYVPAIDGTVS